MLRVLKPLDNLEKVRGHRPLIFLGGTIDMGNSIDWQAQTAEALKDEHAILLNPRRDNWDASWEHDPSPGSDFEKQVSWELDGQEMADICVYNFLPDSKSVITLLELGAFGLFQTTFVCCPKTYFRYGNVAVYCRRNSIEMFEDYDELLERLRQEIREINEK